jgi:hypothetical protein
MYDKVTVTGRKNNNYFGGGATVGPGTFHMYGGTITDCGVDGGSVCFGGGVAAIGGGKFIMDGGLITNCYFEERDVINNSVFIDYFDSVCMSCEMGVKKPDIQIFKKCMKDLDVVAEECIYVGDGGSFELETAKSLGMHPLQATWYLKDGANQPAKKKLEFLQAELPLEVIHEINKYME